MSETVKSESDIEDPTSDASEKAAEDDLAPSASISKATTANDGTADLDENIIRRLVINFHKFFFKCGASLKLTDFFLHSFPPSLNPPSYPSHMQHFRICRHIRLDFMITEKVPPTL